MDKELWWAFHNPEYDFLAYIPTEVRQEARNLCFKNPEEDRCVGAMLGMPLGDALGAPNEFHPVDYTHDGTRGFPSEYLGSYPLKPGQWTDDASMGFCLAESLLACGGDWKPHDCMQRFIAWRWFGLRNSLQFDDDCEDKASFGLGGNIRMALYEYVSAHEEYTKAGTKDTSGNGSVMRLAPVPVFFHDNYNEALRVAGLQSRVTHQGFQAAECCRLLTHVMVKLINGEDKASVLERLGEEFVTDAPSVRALANSEIVDGDPDRDWRWRQDAQYKYSPTRAQANPGYVGSYAMDATAMALHCFYKGNSFKEVVLKAANLCGDADSVAAVAGMLAGACYGASTVPREWIDVLGRWDRGDTVLFGIALCRKLLKMV